MEKKVKNTIKKFNDDNKIYIKDEIYRKSTLEFGDIKKISNSDKLESFCFCKTDVLLERNYLISKGYDLTSNHPCRSNKTYIIAKLNTVIIPICSVCHKDNFDFCLTCTRIHKNTDGFCKYCYTNGYKNLYGIVSKYDDIKLWTHHNHMEKIIY
jgi:hypothetical protein